MHRKEMLYWLLLTKLLDVSGSCVYQRENVLYMVRKVLFVNRGNSMLFSFALYNVTQSGTLLLYCTQVISIGPREFPSRHRKREFYRFHEDLSHRRFECLQHYVNSRCR